MGKSIAVILGLKDQMSPKLLKVKDNVGELTAEQARSLNAANSLASGFVSGCERMLSSAVQLATGAAAILGGIGLAEAFDLEGYKSQLVTATKDTQRASEVMQYAVNMANKTPYEGGDLVAAAAALEMAGLKTEDYLTLLGDTAAGANRKISEVQNGFIKSLTTGDMTEFLQSINISKKSVEEFAKSKGISDLKEALAPFLEEKFGGGMEKLATTAKGLFSTVSGDAKNILASIVGISTEGEVIAGSLLDNIKIKAQEIADTFTRWRENGTIDELREKVSEVANAVFTVGDGALKIIEFLSNPIVAGVVTGLVVTVGLLTTIYKTTMMISGLISAVKTIKAMIDASNISLGVTKALSWSIAASGVIGLIAALAGGVMLSSLTSGSTASGNGLGYDPYNGASIPSNALGTTYFGGGLTRINEHGGEAAILPQGTKILPAQTTANELSGSRQIEINVYIEGAQRSDEELAEVVARRILEEMEDI